MNFTVSSCLAQVLLPFVTGKGGNSDWQEEFSSDYLSSRCNPLAGHPSRMTWFCLRIFVIKMHFLCHSDVTDTWRQKIFLQPKCTGNTLKKRKNVSA